MHISAVPLNVVCCMLVTNPEILQAGSKYLVSFHRKNMGCRMTLLHGLREGTRLASTFTCTFLRELELIFLLVQGDQRNNQRQA